MFEQLEWLLLSAREPCVLLMSVAVIAVVSLAASLAFIVAKAYNQVRGFDGPPCHWFKGHLDQATFDGCGLQFHLKCVERYKTAYRVWFGPTRSAVVLCHPDAIKPVLPSTPKEESVCSLLSPFLGVGLGLQNGERWKSTRKLLTPAFHFETIKSYTKIFQQSAEVLLRKWSASTKGEVELFKDIGLLSLDSILKCAFSYRSDCQVKSTLDTFMTAIHENTQAIMDRFKNPLYHFSFIYNLTPAGRKFKHNSSILARKADKILRERRNNLLEQPEEEARRRQQHYDFLDVLLEAKRENGQSLTDEEVRAEVRTFMFAGLDTVTSALSWILYCLALYPEHQKQCQEEIDSLFEKGNELQWNDLHNVPYLKLCINEAMRLYSPVPIICRSSDKTYDLQGRTVPKGTFLYVNIFALHRNPHVWENPEEFDPLRFTEERSQDRPPHSFIPFSSGIRNCIGQHFAMAEIKTALVMILHRAPLTIEVEGLNEDVMSMDYDGTSRKIGQGSYPLHSWVGAGGPPIFDLTVSRDQLVPTEDLLTILMLRSKTGVRVNVHPRNPDVFHDENENFNHILDNTAKLSC